MKNLGFGYLLIVLMVMCQENFAGDCVYKPANCSYEDGAFGAAFLRLRLTRL